MTNYYWKIEACRRLISLKCFLKRAGILLGTDRWRLIWWPNFLLRNTNRLGMEVFEVFLFRHAIMASQLKWAHRSTRRFRFYLQADLMLSWNTATDTVRLYPSKSSLPVFLSNKTMMHFCIGRQKYYTIFNYRYLAEYIQEACFKCSSLRGLFRCRDRRRTNNCAPLGKWLETNFFLFFRFFKFIIQL